MVLGPMIGQRLREVKARPTAGTAERRRWDELMSVHHHLPFRRLVGRSLRHVAVLGEQWPALIGRHAGAFKLKPRDAWTGWLPEQQFRRLHLITDNTRFVILPGHGVANLASRVPGLSLRRVSPLHRPPHHHLPSPRPPSVPRRAFTRNQLLASLLSRIRSKGTGPVFLESRDEGVRKVLRNGEAHSGRRPVNEGRTSNSNISPALSAARRGDG